MDLRAKTVLIADISRQSAARTAGILEAAGFSVSTAADGGEAYRRCMDETPDAVVADAVLPTLDGAGLAARIRRSHISFRPGIVICTYQGFARKAQLTGVSVIQKPVSADALLRAIAETTLENRSPSQDMLTRINCMLDELGVPAHPGRDFLTDAVFLATEDQRLITALTGRLYPLVARRGGAKSDAVERAMRHVIEKAWSLGSIEKQYSMFRGTIDAARGKPTCGGMIAQLSELMRMEV